MKNDFTRELCNAIFAGKIPDAAIEWPRVQALRTSPMVGSGESTTWRSSITVRLNGKQIFCGSPSDFAYEKPLEKLGELVEFHRTPRHTLFVVKPPSNLCPPR